MWCSNFKCNRTKSVAMSWKSIFNHYPFHVGGNILHLQPDFSTFFCLFVCFKYLFIMYLKLFCKMYYHNLKLTWKRSNSVSCSTSQQFVLTYCYGHSFMIHGHLTTHALKCFGLLFSFLFLNTIMQFLISFYLHFLCQSASSPFLPLLLPFCELL